MTSDQLETDKPLWKKIRKVVRRRVPITRWIQRYKKRDFVADLIAGTTVGLTVIPQSMAYAAIAGLSPEYGLYSSYVGVLIYAVLGSCNQATIGPTAVMGLLTFQTCGQDYPSCAVLTGFYAGVIELLLAALRLGWVVSFISEPVTIGFTSAAACTIMSSQIKSFLGLGGNKGSGFIGYWKAIVRDIGTIHLGDSVLGVCAFIVLMCLRKLKDLKIKNKILKTTVWLISLSRNVIVITITSLIASQWADRPFKIVGHVQGGFPDAAAPPFALPYKYDNSTEESTTEYYSFFESWSVIKAGPMIIALISILQNVAISKAFGSGQKVDATQEMMALGTASVVGSFFKSIPISASFSRSAVNEASGVRSPMGGLYTGILVLLSLSFLTPSFYFIPKASLAAVIISAVMFMIDYEAVLPMWRISRADCVACMVTFLTALLLGMEYGILIGVALSMIALLMKSLRPEIKSEVILDDVTGINYLFIKPSAGINFPSVDHISSSVQKLSLKHKSCRVIVLSFREWGTYDYTAATTVISLVKGMKKSGKIFIFTDCCAEWISVLTMAGLAHPPATVEAELSDYIKKNIVPVLALDDTSFSVKVLSNGEGKGGGPHINCAFSATGSEDSHTSSDVTTSNSNKILTQ